MNNDNKNIIYLSKYQYKTEVKRCEENDMKIIKPFHFHLFIFIKSKNNKIKVKELTITKRQFKVLYSIHGLFTG